MTGKAWLTLAVGLVALAGCIAPPADEIPDELEAALVPAPEGAWFVLEGAIGPDARLSSFTLAVPESAILEEEWGGHTFKFLVLEIAALEAPNAIDRWGLAAFTKDDGALSNVGGFLSVPWTMTEVGLDGGAQKEEAASAAPAFAYVGAQDLEAGDDLHLVLAAVAANEQSFPVALRFLDEAPEHEDEPADDAAEFLRERGATPPVRLAPLAQGSGFDVAFRFEMSGFLPPFMNGIVVETGEVQKDGGDAIDARPLASQRDVTYTISSVTSAGWTMGMAVASGGLGAGTFDIAVEARSESANSGGPVVNLFGFSPTHLLSGYPVAMAIGDGEGAAKTTLALNDVVVHPGTGSFIAIDQIAMGATLDELFGAPAETAAFAGAGVVGNALLLRGESLVLFAHGTSWTFSGVA